jgi:hypothetical protein
MVLATAAAMAAMAAVAPGVALHPGDNIQAIVDAHPAATTYRFSAGTFRLQQITPKSGDVFVGAGHGMDSSSATILTGSRVLEGFERDATTGLYVATNQTQRGQVHGECSTAFPKCGHPEDLFFDRRPLRHVSNASAITNGSWFFDYDLQRILFADDPSGHVVETSVARRAFGSPVAENVTIANLSVMQYAIPAQMGAIGDQSVGAGWRVHDIVAVLNHGAGVHLSSGTISRSNISENGQQGVSCTGSSCLVADNEIAFNNLRASVWAGRLAAARWPAQAG